jgi:hypothetical protein
MGALLDAGFADLGFAASAADKSDAPASRRPLRAPRVDPRRRNVRRGGRGGAICFYQARR